MPENVKRVKTSFDIEDRLLQYLDERAARNRRARCRELEVILETERNKEIGGAV